MSKKFTKDVFVEKAKLKHGEKYDYADVEYVSSSSKVSVICPTHGVFYVAPAIHLRGVGCAKCAGLAKKTTDEFITDARAVHGDKYSYGLVNYVGNKTAVSVVCPIHGEFKQKPNSHLMGQGCPVCGRQKAKKSKTYSYAEFLALAREKHGNKFTYIESSYTRLSDYVTVICPKHGEFKTKAHSHVTQEYGCIPCYRESQAEHWLGNRDQRFSEFEIKARIVHGDKYDYSLVSYENAFTPLNIVCPIHGVFVQTAVVHINDRCGCPSCYTVTSKAQEDLENFVRKELKVDVVPNFVLNDKTQIDIYCPEFSIGIEYNGVYWHSDKYRTQTFHLKKLNQAEAQGIRLVHIYEDEWTQYPEKCKSMLRMLFGREQEIYDARKCRIVYLTALEVGEFLERFHLQGPGIRPSIAYGLTYRETLVAVMCFTTATVDSSLGEIELSRFASRGRVRGGFSRLLSAFRRDHGHEFSSVISFSDKRWSRGTVYRLHGFSYEHTTLPSYWWVYNARRIHKRAFQKQYLEKRLKNYDPNLSEVENCSNHGLWRIWDCGKDKWRLVL